MYQEIFELQAQTLKALANPKRLEIINLLRDQSLSVSEMTTMLNLPQSNLSQHLQILRTAKIVHTKRNGKQIFYEICHPNFIKASDLIREALIENCDDSPLAKKLKTNIKKLLPLSLDPVCGMRISPKLANFTQTHQNKKYYFCASGCLQKFNKNPNNYGKK